MTKENPLPSEEFQKQNNYGYELALGFNNAIYEFAEEHRDASPSAVLGATNIVSISTLTTYSRNRADAERMLESHITSMRNLLAMTPDEMIGKGRNPLNGFSDLTKFQS